MGPFGRVPETGTLFNDSGFSAGGLQPITRISSKAGAWVDQIQVTYGNVTAPAHGGSGAGPLADIVLAAGEYIVSAFLDTYGGAVVGSGPIGTVVGGITFTTTFNNTFHIRGGSTTNATPCSPPGVRYVLLAFAGSSDDYLRSLTLLWGTPPGRQGRRGWEGGFRFPHLDPILGFTFVSHRPVPFPLATSPLLVRLALHYCISFP